MFRIERSMFGHLCAFTRSLHDAGVRVDPGRLIDYCQCLELTGLESMQTFYTTSRAVLVSRQDDFEVFDHVFHAFWNGRIVPFSKRESSTIEECEEGEPAVGDKTLILDTPQSDRTQQAGRESQTHGYSADELLMQRNIATLSDAELDAAYRIVEEIVKAIARYKSRRRVSVGRGKEIDFRHMLRRSVLHGRDGIELRYRSRKIRKARLVLLCDVSGSMEAYSRFAIQFMCALRRALPQLHVAVFSTHMTDITDLLDSTGVTASLKRVSETVPDWSGGTDIGRCIGQFNDHFGRKISYGKTVAVILSDGWDLGETDMLRQQMRHLSRNVHKLIWLNPLLGDADYQPLCRGMATAMPYIDYFLPAHNLASLAKLARTLRSL